MERLEPSYKSPSEVIPGVYLVPIPIPIPLRYVHCYLCKGPSGWTIVDTGFNDPLAQAAWPRALNELGIRPQDIDQILPTHYHPDHIGAAGWLQEWTGARAFLHEPELEQVHQFWGEGTDELSHELTALFAAEGMPTNLAEGIGDHHRIQFGFVQPLPEFTPLPAGSQFRIGDAHYEVLWLPGHTDGLSVFWNPDSGILFAGDMILNKITPNVSLWPRSQPNPLADYLASLRRIEGLGAKLALPGHRTMITDVAGRAREIREHHGERLDQMAELCAAPRGATAWEVTQKIFTPQQLTIHQLRFAMAESLAHLVYMEKQGRLTKQGNRFVQA